MEEKNKKIIGVVAFIVLLVIIFYYFKPDLLTIQPGGSSFDCPIGADFCNVRGVMECYNLRTGEPKVIARIDDFNLGKGWIAYDNGFGGLDSYVYSSTIEEPSTSGWLKDESVSKGYAIDFYRYGNYLYMFKADREKIISTGCIRASYWDGDYPSCPGGKSPIRTYDTGPCIPSRGSIIHSGYGTHYSVCLVSDYYMYTLGAGADVNPSPKYNCEGVEVCEGTTTKYSCQATFTKGSLQIPMEYSSNTHKAKDNCQIGESCVPAIRTFDWYTVYPGDGVEASIVGGDNSFIESQIITSTDECLAPECNGDKTGYWNCTNNVKSKTLTRCDSQIGEVCNPDTATCQPPLAVKSVELADSNGNTKAGFTPNEPITALVNIISSNPSVVGSGKVKLIVWRGEEKIKTYEESPTFSFKGEKYPSYELDIDNPKDVGEYKITMDVSYAGRPLANVDSYPFKVSNAVHLEIQTPYAELTGTSLYTNSPIHIKLIVTDEAGNPIQLYENDKIILDVKLSGVTQTNPNYVTPQEGDGIYEFIYNFNKAGFIVIDTTVERQGVKSNQVHVEAEVKEPKITTTLTNIAMLRAINPSTQTIKFETKGSYVGYVDTNNEVKIIPPGASTGMGDEDVSSTVIRLDTGKYEFSYNFNKIGGYSISIKSTAEGYPIGDKPAMGGITVDPGVTPDECATSEDCPAGKICSEGKCVQKEPPIVLYLIIIGSVVLLIVLIIIIINLSRRRSSPTLGGF